MNSRVELFRLGIGYSSRFDHETRDVVCINIPSDSELKALRLLLGRGIYMELHGIREIVLCMCCLVSLFRYLQPVLHDVTKQMTRGI